MLGRRAREADHLPIALELVHHAKAGLEARQPFVVGCLASRAHVLQVRGTAGGKVLRTGACPACFFVPRRQDVAEGVDHGHRLFPGLRCGASSHVSRTGTMTVLSLGRSLDAPVPGLLASAPRPFLASFVQEYDPRPPGGIACAATDWCDLDSPCTTSRTCFARTQKRPRCSRGRLERAGGNVPRRKDPGRRHVMGNDQDLSCDSSDGTVRFEIKMGEL